MLLATASDHEILSRLATGSLLYFEAAGSQRSRERIDPDREMRTAIAFFRRALAAAPDLCEARLRLGRLLYLQGDLDGATRELDAAIATSPPPPMRYLAALFRGLVAAAGADVGAPVRTTTTPRRSTRAARRSLSPAASSPISRAVQPTPPA
jgi:hypothetical protein